MGQLIPSAINLAVLVLKPEQNKDRFRPNFLQGIVERKQGEGIPVVPAGTPLLKAHVQILFVLEDVIRPLNSLCHIQQQTLNLIDGAWDRFPPRESGEYRTHPSASRLLLICR
jgi:hypothetical protein